VLKLDLSGFGPFESRPELAVAVSGGADSMALLLLADDWARQRGGRAIGLTVDHRLRPEAAEESRQVGAWAAARGIAHHGLVWDEGAPGPDLQAAARQARYRLLGDWCRANHVLHLLTAHHQDDQAETLLLRLERGSGIDGLAAMAPISRREGHQILRPLLKVPGAALRRYLVDARQGWIEDPSNQSDRFARIRWRKTIAAQKLAIDRLAMTAEQIGRARQALEQDHAALSAEAVTLDPAGFAWLDPAKLAGQPEELVLRLLAAVTRTIGGRDFPPRLERLQRLRAGLGTRRSFAGCVLAPYRGKILVQREARGQPASTDLPEGRWVRWDNRFDIRICGARDCRIEPLGLVFGEKVTFPRSVLPSLPAIMDKHGILAVPPLGYQRAGTGEAIVEGRFAPVFPLAGTGFFLAVPPAGTM